MIDRFHIPIEASQVANLRLFQRIKKLEDMTPVDQVDAMLST